MSTKTKIKKELTSSAVIRALSKQFGHPIEPKLDSIELLKKTNKSSIWKFNVGLGEKSLPVILKIFFKGKHKNKVELALIRHPLSTISEFFTDIYHIKEKEDETWVFMEYINQVKGQLPVTPALLDTFIPSIASMHAANYTSKPEELAAHYPFLPCLSTSQGIKERIRNIEKTKSMLGKALKHSKLRSIVKPHASMLKHVLSKGPVFFPELESSGQTLIHGDLHFQNICCYHPSKTKPNSIKLIDWETAKIAPGWFDLIVLVEILMDFRKDWHPKAEEIRAQCVSTYEEEMRKHGITFSCDPMLLYKMAYLQRTLEKGLSTHLRRELQGREGKLLKRYIEKITEWGPELHLF